MDTINNIQALLLELKEMDSSDQEQLDNLIATGEEFLKLLIAFDNDN
jgi:hypothetical protein